MQAIILAAGMGNRLKELTKNNTKCMVKVNGVSLIDRMLHQIETQKVSRIVIVIGYKGKELADYIETLSIKTPIVYVNNAIYDKTNNIYSLALAKDYLCEEDTLLFESDLIVEDGVIKALVDDERDTLALVDKYQSWMDGTCLKLNEDDTIREFVPRRNFKFSEVNEYYKTVNIYKFSKTFSVNYYVPFLTAYQKALGENEYYEQVLRVITMLDKPVIHAKRLNGQKWYEIDDIQDLNIAESRFATDDNIAVNLLQERKGGYWRYPSLLDYCYLVNPYFPPKKMLDEIRTSFDKLITHYPSGMKINSLIAAKNFGIHQENIVLGNGASELIKSLMCMLSGKIGVIRPTFEEYPNRCEEDQVICYWALRKNYEYSVKDIIEFFDETDISNLILINPDNPSGNYIQKRDLLILIEWAKQKEIRLVVDESFADFADEEENSLIENELINMNPHLIVVKSISKSYGVPGLRLGVLASGDIELINNMKKDIAIWNINSFAEFYMQIYEKYKEQYKKALKKFKEERVNFAEQLSSIPGIRVLPSQANYFMVELLNGMTARDVTTRLLVNHEILVKDLSGKIKHSQGQYLRIAIRDEKDNELLVNALKRTISDILGGPCI